MRVRLSLRLHAVCPMYAGVFHLWVCFWQVDEGFASEDTNSVKYANIGQAPRSELVPVLSACHAAFVERCGSKWGQSWRPRFFRSVVARRWLVSIGNRGISQRVYLA